MGNGVGKLSVCFTGGGGGVRRRKEIPFYPSEPLDEGLGHSFCYVRPDPTRLASSKVHSEEPTTGDFTFKSRSIKRSLIRVLKKAISKTVSRGQNSIVSPIKGAGSIKEPDWVLGSEKNSNQLTVSSLNLSSEGSLDDDYTSESQNLQWAQGKAGEDLEGLKKKNTQILSSILI